MGDLLHLPGVRYQQGPIAPPRLACDWCETPAVSTRPFQSNVGTDLLVPVCADHAQMVDDRLDERVAARHLERSRRGRYAALCRWYGPESARHRLDERPTDTKDTR